MTGFAFETVSELILLCFVPLFLAVATVWILWHALKTIEPDAGIQSFLIFVVVIVPFVMFICLGVAATFYGSDTVWFADGIAFEPTVTRDSSWNGFLYRPDGVAMVALASIKVGILR